MHTEKTFANILILINICLSSINKTFIYSKYLFNKKIQSNL